MKIEEFNNIQIAYMRRVGEYDSKNKLLMETFKTYLKRNGLFKIDAIILGIALDNPLFVSKDKLRYDVGIVVTDNQIKSDLPVRSIPDGRYAIFEIQHTREAISYFWRNMERLTSNLSVDTTKPIIERYSVRKVVMHLCEFCIPLK